VDRSQAEALVALVQAYFPRPELPTSTLTAWASELERYDFEDAEVAVRELAATRPYPVLADLIEIIAANRPMFQPEYPALPSPREFVEAAPAEVVEKFRALREKWAAEEEDEKPTEDEIERRRKLRPTSGPKVRMILVGPTAPCDRCEHQQRRHAGPGDEAWKRKLSSACMVPGCVCDGFFPQRAA
jgi:hypothetical protein